MPIIRLDTPFFTLPSVHEGKGGEWEGGIGMLCAQLISLQIFVAAGYARALAYPLWCGHPPTDWSQLRSVAQRVSKKKTRPCASGRTTSW